MTGRHRQRHKYLMKNVNISRKKPLVVVIFLQNDGIFLLFSRFFFKKGPLSCLIPRKNPFKSSFFQLRPLVVDVYPQNVDILHKNP